MPCEIRGKLYHFLKYQTIIPKFQQFYIGKKSGLLSLLAVFIYSKHVINELERLWKSDKYMQVEPQGHYPGPKEKALCSLASHKPSQRWPHQPIQQLPFYTPEVLEVILIEVRMEYLKLRTGLVSPV